MRECEFQHVGEETCGKPAKASIGEKWYCAEHYDLWMVYYRAVLGEQSDVAYIHKEAARRALREASR